MACIRRVYLIQQFSRLCGQIGAGIANGIVLMNVQHILSHVAVLNFRSTRVCTRLLFEPGKADHCEINDGSFCLPQQAHVSLAARVLPAAATRKVCSARSLSHDRWFAVLWVSVCRLSASECNASSVSE